MIKYFELCFENYFGETICVDISVNLDDVSKEFSLPVDMFDFNDIDLYIQLNFAKVHLYDEFVALIPIVVDEFFDTSSVLPFCEFCTNPKSWY